MSLPNSSNQRTIAALFCCARQEEEKVRLKSAASFAHVFVQGAPTIKTTLVQDNEIVEERRARKVTKVFGSASIRSSMRERAHFESRWFFPCRIRM